MSQLLEVARRHSGVGSSQDASQPPSLTRAPHKRRGYLRTRRCMSGGSKIGAEVSGNRRRRCDGEGGARRPRGWFRVVKCPRLLHGGLKAGDASRVVVDGVDNLGAGVAEADLDHVGDAKTKPPYL